MAKPILVIIIPETDIRNKEHYDSVIDSIRTSSINEDYHIMFYVSSKIEKPELEVYNVGETNVVTIEELKQTIIDKLK